MAWRSSQKGRIRSKCGAVCQDAADTQSRYIEAAVAGVLVACLYLPNGNPQPGPKFEYKLAWFERLIRHASTLYASGHPMVLAGDFNVVPTDDDIYNPRLAQGRTVAAGVSRMLSTVAGAGMDRCATHTLSRHPDLYVLGLLSSALAEGLGFAHRSSAAEPRSGAAHA
jgi:exonuclease III